MDKILNQLKQVNLTLSKFAYGTPFDPITIIGLPVAPSVGSIVPSTSPHPTYPRPPTLSPGDRIQLDGSGVAPSSSKKKALEEEYGELEYSDEVRPL